MITNIIMMNIKNLFITTGISVLFGVYSIYNILEYLRILNNHRVKQINSLQHQVNDTNKKYNDLQIKHIELQKNYNELSISYEHINKELHMLQIKLLELQENKIDETYINSNNTLSESTPSIICDELCHFNSEIPRVHMETMNAINDINVDDIDVEFVESLNLEYECNNTEVSSLCGSEKSSIKSRSRSTSITEINWGGLAKKFLFG
jgi:predicted nuclease with TOPRIM domain